jgi:hypothetical protein
MRRLRIEKRVVAAFLVIFLVLGTGAVLWYVPLTRVIFSSSDIDPPLYPEHLSGSFAVTSLETGIHNPSVKVAVDLDKGDEYLHSCIQFCLLNFTLEELEQVSNISTLVDNEQLVGRYWFTMEPPTYEFPLPNSPCTYVWILWIEAESLPETWTIDVTLTLLFSII